MKKFTIYCAVIALLTIAIYYICDRSYPIACVASLSFAITLYTCRDIDITDPEL